MRLSLLQIILGLCACVGELSAGGLGITVHADSAILMNAETGAVLYDKNAKTLRHPASITKVATALYTLHLVGDKLDEVLVAEHDEVASISEEARRRSNYTMPAYWLIPDGTHMGIKKGEELTLQALLYGLLLVSANDGANVMAKYAGGTIPDFVEGLNEYLKKIGCKQTTFYNPHGIYHPKHLTTAYDMALIMKEALKNPTFCEIIGTVQYKRPTTNKQESTLLLQSNKLMRKGKYRYEKAIGGKTGYFSLAGHTFVVAAKDEERTLIAVLLNSKNRGEMFQDAIKMFDTAFNQPKVQRVLLKKGPQTFSQDVTGASSEIKTYLKEDVAIAYYPAEEPKIKCILSWQSLTPPIQKDQQVGIVEVKQANGEVVRSAPLFSQEEVTPTWLWRLRHPFG
ncbi:MAG: D-alanyl-D-alanine carboxypeptidase [Parachlamydiaceae bacterium]|nr:D-alanyl-D-alanine carboxypeptidase [Parachlamydiaceae bacterium]